MNVLLTLLRNNIFFFIFFPTAWTVSKSTKLQIQLVGSVPSSAVADIDDGETAAVLSVHVLHTLRVVVARVRVEDPEEEDEHYTELMCFDELDLKGEFYFSSQ